MNKSYLSLILLTMMAFVPGAFAENIRVLILSGQNNHDWANTTPVIKNVLESTKRFSVTVTESPEKCSFEDFSACNVIVSNWNTFGKNAQVGDWPSSTKDALVRFMRAGGGFVVIHAGGSSFPQWQEYQQIVGGRWGKGTKHGPISEASVVIAPIEHEITKGLSDFNIVDEIWVNMVLQPHIKILASAHSKITNKQEPVAFVTNSEYGRCFNLVLGHDVAAMKNPHWQILCQRGTEWATTGLVQQ